MISLNLSALSSKWDEAITVEELVLILIRELQHPPQELGNRIYTWTHCANITRAFNWQFAKNEGERKIESSSSSAKGVIEYQLLAHSVGLWLKTCIWVISVLIQLFDSQNEIRMIKSNFIDRI